MEMLDRYLESVKKHLPWHRQDDIIAELRANLESQLEEKEAELGRPLTTAEAEAWLKQLGSPMQMAAPYQVQQYLIGPAIFPTYRYVLKLACSWCVVIYCIANVVKFFTDPNPGMGMFLDALLHLPVALMFLAAWCTLVFAAIEFAVTHRYFSMPTLFPVANASLPSPLPPYDQPACGKKPRSFPIAVSEAAFGFLALIWLLLIPRYPWLLLGPGAAFIEASPFKLAPVWIQFYWWIVGLNALQLGWNVLNLWSGRWQQPQPVRQIIYKAIGLIPLLLLLNAPDHALLLLKHPALDQAHYGATLYATNNGVYRGFLIIGVIVTLQLLWNAGSIGLEGYRKRQAAMR